MLPMWTGQVTLVAAAAKRTESLRGRDRLAGCNASGGIAFVFNQQQRVGSTAYRTWDQPIET
jgi:hypothetical protein